MRTDPSQAKSDLAPQAHELTQLGKLCRAAGDPLRVRILRVLAKEAYSVQELCRILERNQPALSHHLRMLLDAGLLSTHREGTFIFYRRRGCLLGDTLDELQRALFETIDSHPLESRLAARRKTVRKHRERLSRQFFESNARRFGQRRDLVAPIDIYADIVLQMLDDAPQHRHALEIGPGDGVFLPMLCRRFKRVTALDNSPQMLAEARAEGRRRKLDNVRFILGDAASAPLPKNIDAVTMNMMLHHSAVPAEIIERAAAALAPGGALLITELCAHDQGWVREACGDLWLGFEPALLDDWARAAGLAVGRSEYLGQRNGFRIQVREFRRPTAAIPFASRAQNAP